jgi:regulator of replication initiation timing
MPSPSQFSAGFGLKPDDGSGDFVFTVMDGSKKYALEGTPKVEHHVMKTNRLYHFPTFLKFKLADDDAKKQSSAEKKQKTTKKKKATGLTKELLDQVKHHLCERTKIILSEYGSPYECKFDEDSFQVTGEENDAKLISIKCLGTATRRMDIPTEAQKRKKEKEASHDDQTEAEIKAKVKEVEKKGFRVVKSHFNTGKCATCDEQIHIGDTIAQSSKGKHSGWSHIDCVPEGLGEHDGNPSTLEASPPSKRQKKKA